MIKVTSIIEEPVNIHYSSKIFNSKSDMIKILFNHYNIIIVDYHKILKNSFIMNSVISKNDFKSLFNNSNSSYTVVIPIIKSGNETVKLIYRVEKNPSKTKKPK